MARKPYVPVGERRAAEIVQLGAAFKGVPEPDLPMKGPAYDKYKEIASQLHQSGKLNIHTKALCEQIGLLHGDNYKRIERGAPISVTGLDKIERILRELRLIDESDVSAPEPDAKENRFSRFGVIIHRGAKKAQLPAS